MAGGAAEADPSDLNKRPYNMLPKETATTPLHEGLTLKKTKQEEFNPEVLFTSKTSRPSAFYQLDDIFELIRHHEKVLR